MQTDEAGTLHADQRRHSACMQTGTLHRYRCRECYLLVRQFILTMKTGQYPPPFSTIPTLLRGVHVDIEVVAG